MRFPLAAAIVPFVALVASTLGVGCEFIANVDRSLIEQPGAGGGSNGGAGGTGAAGNGGTGATSVGGNGGGGVPECTVGTDCMGSDTTCQARTCTDGVCGTANAAQGTPLPEAEQQLGDCKRLVCDGAGAPTTEADADDVPDDDQECTADACLGDEPTFTPAPAGSPCTEGSGAVCDGDGACVECVDSADCNGDTCANGFCVPIDCFNQAQDGEETDIDCGGTECLGCDTNGMCLLDADCLNGVCDGLLCAAPTCNDVTLNGDETDVDCGGGACVPCGPGLGCDVDADCVGGDCSGGTCAPSCSDTVQNGTETDIDCGGACPVGCAVGDACEGNADCDSGLCVDDVCAVVADCDNDILDGAETDVDCGGPACPKCPDDAVCAVDNDCATGVCEDDVCGLNGCSPATAAPLAGSVLFGNAVGSAYSPACFTVSENDMVTFEGPFASHPFTGGRVVGGVATPAASGPFTPTSVGTTATFTMSSAGRFGFYCTAHASGGMKGAVFVTP